MTVLPGNDNASITGSVKGFIETRQALVEIFRSQGMTAARAFKMDPLYLVQASAIHRMRRRMDCDAQAQPGAPEDGSKVAPRSPNAASDSQATEPRLADSLRRGYRRGQRIAPDMNIVMLILLNALIGIILVIVQMGQRSYTRYACNVPTQLRIGDVTMPARITNISRTGAQLRAESLFVPGDRGDILLDGAPFRVKVIWVNPHFLGVKFQRRLKFSPKRLTMAIRYA